MSTSPSSEIPSHRACAHCRSQKVRCIPDDSNPDICQRCIRSGRPCVFTPLMKRKQRKRTDTRVAELEREMRAMRSMLKKKQETTVEGEGEEREKTVKPRRPAEMWAAEVDAAGEGMDGGVQQRTQINAAGSVRREPAQGEGPSLWPETYSDRSLGEQRDVIDTGLLSIATARHLVDTYRTSLFPHYPLVVIPESISADELRNSKPTLFLAVLAAAAGKEHPDLSLSLDTHVLHAYANRSLVNSEKSLELVQALLISAVWYHPPQKFGQLKYYEYTHMAATMAMDIGIGTRPVQHRSRFGAKGRSQGGRATPAGHPAEDASNPDLSMTPRSWDSAPDTASLESRRTFLACYVVCAAISLSLRRPNMLRVNSYIRECMEHVETSPQAVASDRTLIAWIRLIIIGEEISVSFSYDDPGGIATISDLRTQLMLKDFEKRLAAWYDSVSDVDLVPSLTIMYYTVRLYLHEIALHVDHSPDDFKAPFQMGVIHTYDGPDIPTQALMEAVAECISCSQALLDTFLSMDVGSLRALPVFSYVRVSFAAFILAKLCLSASHPQSRISDVLDRSSLRVESYMDRTILHVRDIVGPSRCRVPAIFLALLFKLRQWCLNPEMIDQDEDSPALSSDADTPESVSQPIRNQRALEGSRFTEINSSDETSPQGAATRQSGLTPSTPLLNYKDYADTNGNVRFSSTVQQDTPSNLATSITPSLQPDVAPIQPNAVSPSFGTAGPATSASMSSTVFSEQMEVDKDFMNLWNEMSETFPEGGLTGLDDWATLPTDVMGFGPMSEGFEWHDGGETGL